MHPGVRTVILHARKLVVGCYAKIRDDNTAATHAMVVFDMHCHRARALFLLAKFPRKEAFAGNVPVTIIGHEDVPRLIGRYYELEGLQIPPVEPGDVRTIVLTDGVCALLTARRTGEMRSDHTVASPRHALLMVTAAYRSDGPEGFLYRQVFDDQEEGDRFLADYLDRVASLATETQESVEAALRAVGPTYKKATCSYEQMISLFAQIGWLEKNEHIKTDNFNGVELLFGPQALLASAQEVLRELSVNHTPVFSPEVARIRDWNVACIDQRHAVELFEERLDELGTGSPPAEAVAELISLLRDRWRDCDAIVAECPVVHDAGLPIKDSPEGERLRHALAALTFATAERRRGGLTYTHGGSA